MAGLDTDPPPSIPLLTSSRFSSLHSDVDGLFKDHSGAVLSLHSKAVRSGRDGDRGIHRPSWLGEDRYTIQIDLHERDGNGILGRRDYMDR